MLRGVRSLMLLLVAGGLTSAALLLQGQSPKPVRLPVVTGEPRYWKGNLHTHSFWSDGDDFPEMIADWYKQHGYEFLGLSDHNILSVGEKWIFASPEDPKRGEAVRKYLERFGPHWVEQRVQGDKPQVRLKPLAEFRSLLEEPGRFLLIPAEEVTGRFGKYPVHLNAINLRDLIQPTQGANAGETVRVNLRAVADQEKRVQRPMLGFVNHPNFQWGLKTEDLLAAEELRFFEVYNGHPGVRNSGDKTHPSTERMWDILLALRLGKLGLPVVYGLATDDAHGYHEFGIGKVNPGRGWIMVQTPFLTAEAIVRAMHAGRFYLSTGVHLSEITRDGPELRLAIRAEDGVRYRTEFIVTTRDAALDSKPALDDKGQAIDTSRIYDSRIGQVAAEVLGDRPVYRMTGKELYVRAKVTSSKPHPNPYQRGDLEVAWTQPYTP